MIEKVKEWEFRQDHHEELMICLKETGCLGPKSKQIRRMCPELWKMLAEFGHDAVRYEDCRCSLIVKLLKNGDYDQVERMNKRFEEETQKS